MAASVKETRSHVDKRWTDAIYKRFLKRTKVILSANNNMFIFNVEF